MNNISRVVSAAARRRPPAAAFSSSAAKLSQRGFAVAASQQVASQWHHGSENHGYSTRVGGLLAAAAAVVGASAIASNDRADCCGIAGVVGGSGDARDFLLEGLTILKNRGYDSAGIATVSGNPADGLVSVVKNKWCYQCLLKLFSRHPSSIAYIKNHDKTIYL
jgi:hypothetical protein